MGLLEIAKRRAMQWLQRSTAPQLLMLERQLVMQAITLARVNRKINRLPNLAEVEFSTFSQSGEDGIIDWLISRLPGIPETFVEFGVENYRESNTRLLLQMRNWRGLVMDGSSIHIRDIRNQDIYWRYGLTANCAFIDRDNINDLLRRGGMSGEIGVLSVDVDGNDYWIWQAIHEVKPALVVCEYNAVFGDRHALTVPYDAEFQRTRAHHSNLYFGASLLALVQLGTEKGYKFVGTTSNGCNAFFVRSDLSSSVMEALSGAWAFPSKVKESRDKNGSLLFVDGAARAEMIAHLPLVDLRNGAMTSLASNREIYSEAWKMGKRVLV